MKPTDMGPVKWCRACREWWPVESYLRKGGRLRPRCIACRHEAAGTADNGNKGETAFLHAMGYSAEVIAERLGQPIKIVLKQLARHGLKPRWRERGYCGAVYVA